MNKGGEDIYIMVKFNGINHLAMATKDIDMTIRFWRDLIGMRLASGLGGPGYRHYFFQISDTDLIAFFEWDGLEPAIEKEHGKPVKGRFIFDHVSIGVEKEDDLWELKDRLEVAGFEVSGVIDHGFIHSIYSFDPNGIPIEFSANVPGRDIRKNPVIKDDVPSDITMEGTEPVPDKWPAVKKPTPESKKTVTKGAGSRLFS